MHAYARVEHVVTAAVGVREREDSKGKGEARGRDARRSREEKKDALRSEGIGRDGDSAWFIGRRTTRAKGARGYLVKGEGKREGR